MYTNDKQTEKEIGETTPFTIVSNNRKYLVVTLTKQGKYLYDKNFKTLEEDIEQGIRRWKALPCSWICGINAVKMAILSKAICRFNTIPIKIPTHFFTDPERAIFSFTWKHTQKKPTWLQMTGSTQLEIRLEVISVTIW